MPLEWHRGNRRNIRRRESPQHARQQAQERSGLTGTKNKVAVIGAIARKGMVVAQVIENTDTATLDSFVRRTVSKDVKLVATDEHSGYRLLGADMDHRVVRHGAGRVRGRHDAHEFNRIVLVACSSAGLSAVITKSANSIFRCT